MTVIDCRGAGLERGRAHGESTRTQVRTAIDHWAQQSVSLKADQAVIRTQTAALHR